MFVTEDVTFGRHVRQRDRKKVKIVPHGSTTALVVCPFATANDSWRKPQRGNMGDLNKESWGDKDLRPTKFLIFVDILE